MTQPERITKQHPSQKWLPYMHRQSAIKGRTRLFCFPYAGGCASAFNAWLKLFPNEIEVCPIQLAGRENRWNEPPCSSLPQMLPLLANALLPYLDGTFAFLGHSMGALICFELAHYLGRVHGLYPVHLFASACRAPQQPDTEAPTSRLADAAFIQHIHQDYHGIPEALLADAEFMGLYLPMLRADFALVETYTYQPAEPLPCPITAVGGLQDSSVSHAQLQTWAEQTSSTFRLQMFPGDHFFLRGAQAALIQTVIQDLTRSLNLL
jgi:surfactin synthase thioesterase subunit